MGWLSAIVIGFAVLGGVVFCVGCGYIAGFVRGWMAHKSVEDPRPEAAVEELRSAIAQAEAATEALRAARILH